MKSSWLRGKVTAISVRFFLLNLNLKCGQNVIDLCLQHIVYTRLARGDGAHTHESPDKLELHTLSVSSHPKLQPICLAGAHMDRPSGIA